MLRRETRIGVVGGGVSGLSAAYFLKKAGYQNVTVFEKEARLGGKCKTVFFEERSYEMGAVLHVHGAEPVTTLVREFGIETVKGMVSPRPRLKYFLFDPQRNRHFRYPRISQALVAAIRYTLLARLRPEICCEGHENMTADLAMPVSVWLATNRLDALELLFACWLSGCGYGYAERI